MILRLSIIFVILWSIWLLSFKVSVPFSTTDNELYFKLSMILISVISVIIYTITLIKFLAFIKRFEITNKESLLKLASFILLFICLVSIAYNLLFGVIAFIHYLGLVNYSDFEQYQYYLDFIHIFLNVIYSGLLTYYVLKMKGEFKKQFYPYLITVWIIYLLPYISNNFGLHLDMWLKESLVILEIVAVFIILLVSKDKISKTLDN